MKLQQYLRATLIVTGLGLLAGAACSRKHAQAEGGHHEEAAQPVVLTSPSIMSVPTTQAFVCRMQSRRHIEIRALNEGYLEEIPVQEGQAVRAGDRLYELYPVLYRTKLEAEKAELRLAEINLQNTEKLAGRGFVSAPELARATAERDKAKANFDRATAEAGFTSIVAPFDGIVGRQLMQHGSLIEAGDTLTTLSDNAVMWVYFNVPEASYLEYKEELDKDNGHADRLQIELKLANGRIFSQPGKIGAIEADFNNMTGNISFRADFPNPQGLLRNGQTGTILIHRKLDNVIVIPQRATFEILDKRYAFVIDEENVVHQRDITIQSVQDDIFVISEGLHEGDKIILEGIRQVRDGDKIGYEFHHPDQVLANLKFHAE